jgi:hypothetical protein
MQVVHRRDTWRHHLTHQHRPAQAGSKNEALVSSGASFFEDNSYKLSSQQRYKSRQKAGVIV